MKLAYKDDPAIALMSSPTRTTCSQPITLEPYRTRLRRCSARAAGNGAQCLRAA